MSVAIITGAGRGMGAATARRLAGAGWNLVLVDAGSNLEQETLGYELSTLQELEDVAAECGGADRAVAVAADVRDQKAVDAAVQLAVERFGGLDAAVAVAGAIAGGQPSWETSNDTWSAMLSINLDGVWRLAHAAVPALLQRPEPRQGRFIAVASAGGMVGLPYLAAYCAAKHGVIGLVRALAAELGQYGVTANAIAPGSTSTAMLDASARVYELETTETFQIHHLLPRLLDPDEPAALLAWLCSPDSSGITGAVLPVDAGMTAH